MKNKTGILFLKLFVLSVPVLILLASYLYYDPFRVLHNYSNYQSNNFIALDRDYVSTQVYLNNKNKFSYNAYIFGSSRSLSFLCSDWQQYIPGTVPFHYDANSESLLGIRDKLRLIDKKNGKIDHVLIIADKSLLQSTGYLMGHIYEPHPATGNMSLIDFHSSFFKSYLSEFFFIKYIDYYYTRKYKSYMDKVIDPIHIEYDPVTNDFNRKVYDDEIEKDPVAYVIKHKDQFPDRDTSATIISPAVIHEKQTKLLQDIYSMFAKHHTQYKIIISPLYNRQYLNKQDLEKLQTIFGKENIYDFSGKNKYTSDIRNYYEQSHFRPIVARDILKKIYLK